MRGKLDQIRLSAATLSLDYDIIVLTETWLNCDVHDLEIELGPYIIFRDDRSEAIGSRGGGVLIAVHKSLLGKPLHLLDNGLFSFNQLYVILPEIKIIIGSTYIPPSSDILSYQEHIMHVEDISNTYLDHHLIIVGDYNLPGISWNLTGPVLSHCFEERTISSTRTCATTMIDTFNLLGLNQYNPHPNLKNNTLDLCFSNLNVTVNLSNDLLSIVDVFHPVLNISFDITNNSRHTSPSYYPMKSQWDRLNFKKCNTETLSQRLDEIDWDASLGNLSLPSAADKFYDLVNPLIEETSPKKHCYSGGYPVWFSKKLIFLINNKKLAHKKYKNNQNNVTYDKFKNIRSLCKSEASLCYSNYISNIESNIPNNIKIFWDFINNKRKTTGYPSTMFLDTSNCSNDTQMSNLFAEFFKEVYSLSDAQFDPDIFIDHRRKDPNVSTNSISISEEEITRAIRDLKPSLSLGADGIPAFLIKSCSSSLIKPLHILFNLSLLENSIPVLWKKTFVTPIFKSGSRNNIRNYRPIAIISAIPKILDKIMYNKIFLLCSNTISVKQHGFVPSRSTVTNLTLFTNSIFTCFNRNTQLDAIYLDFKKAFDLINHKILLSKLKNILPHNLILWIKDYLSDRYSSVRINSIESQKFLVPSGVPQGSHLGPLLFLLFVNDVSQVIKHSNILLFADDIKLFLEISTSQDCLKLQTDLNNLIDWCKTNLFLLNFDKCFLITFSKRDEFISHIYMLNNPTPCIRVTTIKDLGIIFDAKLTFQEQITHVVSRANQIWGFIVRNTKDFRNPYTTKYLFLSLVKSVIMYGSTIWKPNLKINIARLERVQHKALRHLAFISNCPMSRLEHDYSAIAEKLSIPTILSSMNTSDNLFTFKILSDSVHCPELKNLFPLHELSYTLRHHQPFYPQIPTTRHSENDPIYRLCIGYNDLSRKIGLPDFTMDANRMSRIIKSNTLTYN